MFTASKYEEIISPSIRDFVFITNCSFEVDQILRTEERIL